MSPPAPKSVRRRFLAALARGLHITWPVLSGILVIEVALGLLIGFVEGWSVGEAVYFSFVTGLTIGYGDIVPRQTLTRALAVVIGFGGILLTGLVAGIAVNAMRATLADGGGRRLRSRPANRRWVRKTALFTRSRPKPAPFLPRSNGDM